MKPKLLIFIVEDDPWYGQILQYHLSLNPELEPVLIESGEECLNKLYHKPDIITLDFSLPGIQGDKLFKKIREKLPDVPVIMISAQEKVATAVEMLKLGVNDYLIKDEHTKDLLWNSVNKLKENFALKEEVKILKEQLSEKNNINHLIKGNSPAIVKLHALIEKAAKTNINVSVTGETGTGKELVAQAVHLNSERSKKPFIAVNMAAIPAELLESELFGHEKGAFTGALQRKLGKFEEANNGTIFLDEIAELNLSLQSKILRVLQERELQRVGGSEKVKLNVRLIVASHKNLAEEVKKGTFREDLYYRIMGMPVQLPPLRDRGNDILLLAKYFLSNFCKENKLSEINLQKQAFDKLLQYPYPGNVRELKSIIELAAVMCEGNEISSEDILFNPAEKDNGFLQCEMTLKEYNISIIKHYLNKYDKNVLLVAEKLDVGKSTIYKMIQTGEL